MPQRMKMRHFFIFEQDYLKTGKDVSENDFKNLRSVI